MRERRGDRHVWVAVAQAQCGVIAVFDQLGVRCDSIRGALGPGLSRGIDHRGLEAFERPVRHASQALWGRAGPAMIQPGRIWSLILSESQAPGGGCRCELCPRSSSLRAGSA